MDLGVQVNDLCIYNAQNDEDRDLCSCQLHSIVLAHFNFANFSTMLSHSLLASLRARSAVSLLASSSTSVRSLATQASSTITSIRPSRDEIVNMRLSQRSIQAALEALRADGIVVVEDVVNKEAIDKLNSHMEKDTHTLMARGEKGPFNYNLGNLQQSPPYDPDLFSPSIFVNPFGIQVTNAYLGERPTMSFISANSAVKAEVGQPVHSDADFSHPSVSRQRS